jgi:hypothetical protein
MTIKASGAALSLTEIASEYSGTGSHALTEYYTAPGLPSSGAISFSDFYNKSDVIAGPNVNTTASTSWVTSYTTYWQVANPSDEKHPYNYNRTTSRFTSRNTTISTSTNTTWSADNPT